MIKTYCNRSNSYQKGILGQINYKIYILGFEVQIALHIKYKVIWSSFSIGTKIRIETCHNVSNSHQ